MNYDHHVKILVGGSTKYGSIWLRPRPRYGLDGKNLGTNSNYRIRPKKILQLTNIVDRKVIVNPGASLGWWMNTDMIPRSPVYVSVGSRRYNEWQTLACEATKYREEESPLEPPNRWWINLRINTS